MVETLGGIVVCHEESFVAVAGKWLESGKKVPEGTGRCQTGDRERAKVTGRCRKTARRRAQRHKGSAQRWQEGRRRAGLAVGLANMGCRAGLLSNQQQQGVARVTRTQYGAWHLTAGRRRAGVACNRLAKDAVYHAEGGNSLRICNGCQWHALAGAWFSSRAAYLSEEAGV